MYYVIYKLKIAQRQFGLLGYFERKKNDCQNMGRAEPAQSFENFGSF